VAQKFKVLILLSNSRFVWQSCELCAKCVDFLETS